ncbi:MAG: sigma-70 family RNA polymerase sigma factor [bacterium]|nr:sigma-70 family RNA polymerase sigma factor [bacterium]
MHNAAFITTTLLLSRLHDDADEEAWNLFDRRFRKVLVATAGRLGLNASDAEDAAQETMLQALRDYRAGRYDRTRGRLSSWILGIAHHRISDAKRRGNRSTSRPDHANDCDEAALSDAFECELEREIFNQAWEMVRDESQMASNTLLAFELTAIRGVPAGEAARQSEMTVEQVYVARTRVAKRLREVVEDLDRAVRDGL